MTDATPRLSLERVSKSWLAAEGELRIVTERLEIASGAMVAVLGDSGCGKSTLLNLLALALAPTAAARFELYSGTGGRVDLAGLWRRGKLDALAGLRARYFGYVPQTGGLLPFLSVRENIEFPQRLSGRFDRSVIADLTERLGIADQLAKRPAALSVGQRQRAAIARALGHRPLFVLADEPTASVQANLAGEIMALLVERSTAHGAALVVATHSTELVDGYPMSMLRPSIDTMESGVRVTFRPSAA